MKKGTWQTLFTVFFTCLLLAGCGDVVAEDGTVLKEIAVVGTYNDIYLANSIYYGDYGTSITLLDEKEIETNDVVTTYQATKTSHPEMITAFLETNREGTLTFDKSLSEGAVAFIGWKGLEWHEVTSHYFGTKTDLTLANGIEIHTNDVVRIVPFTNKKERDAIDELIEKNKKLYYGEETN